MVKHLMNGQQNAGKNSDWIETPWHLKQSYNS